jgi:hypothetical protein
VKNVNLRFVHTETGARASARTDGDGRFATTGLVAGTYSAEASTGTTDKLETKKCGTFQAGRRDVELRLPD